LICERVVQRDGYESDAGTPRTPKAQRAKLN
jgi:hypothetical protein